MRKTKIISVALVLGAGGILTALLLPMLSIRNIIYSSASKGDFKPNKFSKITFKTTDKRGKPIRLKSEKVTESKDKIYNFNKMRASFVLSNGEKCKVKADKMEALNAQKTQCLLSGRVQCLIGDDTVLSTNEAYADFEKKIISGTQSVNIIRKTMQVRGKLYNYDIDKGILEVEHNAQGLVNTSRIFADKIILYLKETSFEAFGEEIILNIPKYLINVKKRLTYKENQIEAAHGAQIIFQNSLGKNKISSPHMIADLEKNGVLKEIRALRSIIIQNNMIKVIADKGILRDGRVFVSGSVIISGPQGNISARDAVFNLNSGRVTLSKAKGVVNSER